MRKYPEYKLVQKCLLLIEDNLDWGTSNEWHNDVFNELSENIHIKTNVLLSTTTLKRVWGKVNYASAPSISTLNALSQYAGYENWRDFKNKAGMKPPSWFERKIASNMGIIVISSAIMTLVFISLFSLIGINDTSRVIDISKIEFSCHPVTENIPNSVVFDFDINSIKSDSIYIQQFWDETKTIKIKPNQKQATGIYYYPGYFRAKLLVDNNIIKENDLFIKSNGWLGTIDYVPIPKYLKRLKRLSFPQNTIEEIQRSNVPLTSTFHLVNDFKEVSGDHFILNTTIKNTYNDKWAVCQKATIIIVGTKSAHLIPFTISGCASDMSVMISDVYLNGKENDLSDLCIDLSTYKNLKIEVIDKQLTVFIEDKIRFSKAYNESIGNIVGLRYRFLGAGDVKEIKLSNISGNTIIVDEKF
ncbi:hypothetical protein [Flavivirga spongiicola]|uniref:Uncharacterized protein n=1 Tax=Flavivirga spongiicola TaxID=421621 RepID=A0ABU7Y052_9FLAO|nr:hypothetical protein [Flavivirga sp. MEBiC05379]MDO5980611.1 hypothetical protein [Flavivirga sp. MEBiC05379]